MAALAGTGRKIIELPGVTPNPRLDKALEGVRLVKEHGVGLIPAKVIGRTSLGTASRR